MITELIWGGVTIRIKVYFSNRYYTQQIMIKFTRILLVSLLLIAGLSACAKKLYQPAPIEIFKPVKLNNVRLNLLGVLREHGWTVEKDWKNLIQANHQIKHGSARIRIPYDTSHVRIEYAGSHNLKYQSSPRGPKINNKYNKLVKRLEKDFRNSLHSTASVAVAPRKPKRQINYNSRGSSQAISSPSSRNDHRRY